MRQSCWSPPRRRARCGQGRLRTASVNRKMRDRRQPWVCSKGCYSARDAAAVPLGHGRHQQPCGSSSTPDLRLVQRLVEEAQVGQLR